jgi:hypothetical protein
VKRVLRWMSCVSTSAREQRGQRGADAHGWRVRLLSSATDATSWSVAPGVICRNSWSSNQRHWQ